MKIDALRGLILIIWIAGSLHTAATTASLVMVNRNVTGRSKIRFVLMGGPAVWLVLFACFMAAMAMSAIYRWKNRHVEKGQG
jgi:hypothetical protein